MNLIICCTPLQVLIAEKIMALFPNEQFFGVMLHTVENKKFDYYKQRLKQQCVAFISHKQETERKKLFLELVSFKFKFLGKQFDKVFVANINELTVQVILSAAKFKQLNTFDDGTANIVPHSIFYQESTTVANRKMINCLLYNPYSTQKLRQLSQQHYTIYPNQTNIIKNTVNLELVAKNQAKQTACDENKTLNIFLGQPVFSDENKNKALAEKVIKQFKIDYYFPHPREKHRIDGVEYVESELIFEDYFTQHFANQSCIIYTYFSGAIINVMNISETIKVAALRIDVDDPAYLACYDLFEQVGIPIIDIRT